MNQQGNGMPSRNWHISKQNPNNRSDSNTLQCNNKVTSVVYICTCAQPARKLNAFLKLTPKIKVNYKIFIIFLATVFGHWRWSVSQLWTLKQLGTPIKPNATYYPHLESITNGPKLPACKCTCRIVSAHNACMSVHIMPVCQCTCLYVSARNTCMSVHVCMSVDIMPVCQCT